MGGRTRSDTDFALSSWADSNAMVMVWQWSLSSSGQNSTVPSCVTASTPHGDACSCSGTTQAHAAPGMGLPAAAGSESERPEPSMA